MLILQDFWKGDCPTGETRYHPKSQYTPALSKMEKCAEHLKQVLSDEDWKIFSEYTNAELDDTCLSNCDNFIDGFRLGVKMMLDVLM